MDFTAILQGVNPILIFILLCFVGLVMMFYRTMRSLDGLEHTLARTSQELKERMRAMEDRPVSAGVSEAMGETLAQLQGEMKELAAQQKRTAKGLRDLAAHAAESPSAAIEDKLDRLVALQEQNAAAIAGLTVGTVAASVAPDASEGPVVSEADLAETGQQDEEELLEPVFDLGEGTGEAAGEAAGQTAEEEGVPESTVTPEDAEGADMFAAGVGDTFFATLDEELMSAPEMPEDQDEDQDEPLDAAVGDSEVPREQFVPELLDDSDAEFEGPDGFTMPEEVVSDTAVPEEEAETEADVVAPGELLPDELLETSDMDAEDELEPDYEPTMEIDMSGLLPEEAEPSVPAKAGRPPAKAPEEDALPAMKEPEEPAVAEEAVAPPAPAEEAAEPPRVDEEELDLDAFDLSAEELEAAGMEPDRAPMVPDDDFDLDFELADEPADKRTSAGPAPGEAAGDSPGPMPPAGESADAFFDDAGDDEVLDFDLDLVEAEPRKKGAVAAKPQPKQPSAPGRSKAGQAATRREKAAGVSLPDLGGGDEGDDRSEGELTIEQAASVYAQEPAPAKAGKAGPKRPAAKEEPGTAKGEAAPGAKAAGGLQSQKGEKARPWENEDTVVLEDDEKSDVDEGPIDLDATVVFDQEPRTPRTKGKGAKGAVDNAEDALNVEFLLDDAAEEDDFDLSDADAEDAFSEVDFDDEDTETDDDFQLDLDDMSMSEDGEEQDAADYLERVIDFKELDSIQLEEMDADKD